MAVVKNQKFVVALTLENGEVIRGIESAWYAHTAMRFFAKRMGVTYKVAQAETLESYNLFLAKGLRKPL